MSIKLFLKTNLSSFYKYYQHLGRTKARLKAERMKKKTEQEEKIIIAKQYKKCIGKDLDWDCPRRYTEKMQVAKLYKTNKKMADLSDKYLVRNWVKEKIGSDYLIPLLGVWDSFSEIDFSSLPKQFVLKTNHGTGTIIIVKDKDKIDFKDTKSRLDDWMKTDYGYTTYFEKHYSLIERKIIAEQYLETELGELQDYKFLCFHGEPLYCWVDLGRFGDHSRTVFDMSWNLQPWTQSLYGVAKNPIPKPKNFEAMIEIARKLCSGFDHVRVDLYNVEGKIFFGEMTFTNGSGLDRIVPDEYDEILGSKW